ncbi:MAG: hypothetical protein KDE27_22175 [Planctomycetes bacterium]|nr:hypothetical protein [Planctomycetota bacterium]
MKHAFAPVSNPLLLMALTGALTALCAAQAAPAPNDGRSAKLYDVGDLVSRVAAFDVTPASPDDLAAPPRAAVSPNSPDAVVRLVRAFVRPPLAANEEVKAVGERWIAVVGRAEQHAWVDRFFAAARGAAPDGPLIRLRTRCFALPELAFARDVQPALRTEKDASDGKDGKPPADKSYVTEVLVPGKSTAAFLTAIETNKEAVSIDTPEVVVRPLAIGSLSLLQQTAYVRDFEVEVAKQAFIADPVVDVVRDGIVLETAATPLEDGRLGISIEAHITDLERPIETREIDLGGGQKVKIQLPHLQSTRIESAVELSPGHILLLAPPPLAGKRTFFVVEIDTVQ